MINDNFRRKHTIFSEIKTYFLRKPGIATQVEIDSKLERDLVSKRIMQRLDMGVDDYSILNVHKIGIQVPVRYVFEELLRWDKDSIFWPNRIARVDRVDDRLENINIFLFGRKLLVYRFKRGFDFLPLFRLNAIKFQKTPDSSDMDNARYLLYKCSGGYPIGILSIYARSSIREEGDIEQTQLFFIVAFNFYGKKNWVYTNVINKVWNMVHNRVTGNVLNRIKKSCEWKFRALIENL